MRLYKCAFLCALLALSILEPIAARKSYGGRGSGGHSYPKSGGLSGGGHNYPSSGGLSGGGGGGSHGYPSGGLSGGSSGGSHGYPSGGLSGGSSGGVHGYPSSGGLSGGGSGGNPKYPSSGGSHGYPSSGGSHGYPSSGGGLSGSGSPNVHHSNNHGYPANKGVSGAGTTTVHHHHYHYSPPQQISYAPVRGAAPMSYPVYRGTPPTYVYQYKDSGSKYGTLLAGLALLNLGTLGALGASAYAHNHNSNSGSSYKTQPGEVCKFGVKKNNGYEETRIDCQLISSFILQEQAKPQTPQTVSTNTTITTSTVTNITTVNAANGQGSAQVNLTASPYPLYQKLSDGTLVPLNRTAAVNQSVLLNPLYQMLPNGTLALWNVTAANVTVIATNGGSAADNTLVTSIQNTTTVTTVTNALDVKGKPVEVTPDMQCYVIRHTSSTDMKREVPCGLLQTYADKSLKKNSAARNAPAFTIVALVFAAFFVY